MTSPNPSLFESLGPPARAGRIASESQRAAIEAGLQPLLVLAGPGAGKTYCLIERIRFLIDARGIQPDRVCAFTFTNKAAGEIAERLGELGTRAARVRCGTVHAFCSELLREFGPEVGLQAGFGIADEKYQLAALRRVGVPERAQGAVLRAFACYRFRQEPLSQRDLEHYERYRRFLEARNVADFDMLVVKAAELFQIPGIRTELRNRWDAVLVDEFQDLNPLQYAIVRELAREHRNLFAVGDDQQSIYSWAGADPRVFRDFARDFDVPSELLHRLRENRRCPREVVHFAQRLMAQNEPLFGSSESAPLPDRVSPFPVRALAFEGQDAEQAWILDDLRREHREHDLDWGDVAVLYRMHMIGDSLEAALLEAGIPCRLAKGRALSEDAVVAYVLAALRVIANPADDLHREAFYRIVLPGPLYDHVRAEADSTGKRFLRHLADLARELPSESPDRKKIWRGHYALQNLEALARTHDRLTDLVEKVLSERVGTYRTVLEERQDELSDPAGHAEVVALAERLERALAQQRPVWLPSLGGAEIGLSGLLEGAGFPDVLWGEGAGEEVVRIEEGDLPTLGIALGLFKALQLLRTRDVGLSLRDFVAVDLETTDKDIHQAEVVEIAAVRVRAGKIVDRFESLVRPRVPITAGAAATHGITEESVAAAPRFEEIWPAFRAFCGQDVLVAHNGYMFDFPILRRMGAELPGGARFCTYDTLPLARALHPTSARLENLAALYGIPTGQSHRALDDTITLAELFIKLAETRLANSRRTAIPHLLDHLGVALALSEPATLCPEAATFLDFSRIHALGRHSDCLEQYRMRRERDGGAAPPVDELIARLGGEELMQRVRADRSADERYPAAMARLRRLLGGFEEGSLSEQVHGFLERVVLSKHDGPESTEGRVNLFTLHATKGLEFSRVYIVGAEDGQMPGIFTRTPTPAEVEESRRLLYVGMTRAKDRLVLTCVAERDGKAAGGHRFLDEMGLRPEPCA